MIGVACAKGILMRKEFNGKPDLQMSEVVIKKCLRKMRKVCNRCATGVESSSTRQSCPKTGYTEPRYVTITRCGNVDLPVTEKTVSWQAETPMHSFPQFVSRCTRPVLLLQKYPDILSSVQLPSRCQTHVKLQGVMRGLRRICHYSESRKLIIH